MTLQGTSDPDLTQDAGQTGNYKVGPTSALRRQRREREEREGASSLDHHTGVGPPHPFPTGPGSTFFRGDPRVPGATG